MLLLLQDKKRVVNLDCVTMLETSSLTVIARLNPRECGIVLGEYDSVQRCENIIAGIYKAYSKGSRSYTMPQK